MAISLVTIPRIVVTNVKTTYQFGVFNPIIWQWQRTDGTFSAIASDGGNCKLTVNSSVGLIEGDYVWIAFASVYTSGYYEITDVADSTHITINLIYSSTTTGTYTSLTGRKSNYYLKFWINNNAKPFNKIIYGYPDKSGLITIDTSAFLRDEIDLKFTTDDFDYLSSKYDPSKGRFCNVYYCEYWDESSESVVVISSYYPKYIGSCMKFQEEYAPCMYNYDLEAYGIDRAKFMTRFLKPTVFVDRPSDYFIGLVYEIGNAATDLDQLILMYDSSGNYLDYKKYDIATSSLEAIYRFILGLDTWVVAGTVLFKMCISANEHLTGITNGWEGRSGQVFGTFEYNAGTHHLSTIEYMSNGGFCESNSFGTLWAGQRVLIMLDDFNVSEHCKFFIINATSDAIISDVYEFDEDHITGVYNGVIDLAILTKSTNAALVIGFESPYNGTANGYIYFFEIYSDILEIDYNAECISNEIYLGWFNSLGGIDYWRFGHHQEESLEVTKEIYERYVDDMENDESVQNVLNTKVLDVYKMGASNLTSQQILAIKEILYSPKVCMLVNPDSWETDGAKWKTVIVRPETFLIRKNDESMSSIEFDIELPKINTAY